MLVAGQLDNKEPLLLRFSDRAFKTLVWQIQSGLWPLFVFLHNFGKKFAKIHKDLTFDLSFWFRECSTL